MNERERERHTQKITFGNSVPLTPQERPSPPGKKPHLWFSCFWEYIHADFDYEIFIFLCCFWVLHASIDATALFIVVGVSFLFFLFYLRNLLQIQTIQKVELFRVLKNCWILWGFFFSSLQMLRILNFYL